MVITSGRRPEHGVRKRSGKRTGSVAKDAVGAGDTAGGAGRNHRASARGADEVLHATHLGDAGGREEGLDIGEKKTDRIKSLTCQSPGDARAITT